MTKERAFKVFVDEEGISEVIEWRNKLPKNFKARINRIVAHLEAEKDMRCKWFKCYIDNIYELRLPHKRIEYRLLGCHGPMENEFTLLVPAQEKGGKLKPRNSFPTAQRRRILIFEDRGYVDDYV